ncbi:MAG: PKD domain-containing protein, partial [Bacteroidota bacterium]|nr:PKD domain-containing protein [Bacteroidota bacterium]
MKHTLAIAVCCLVLSYNSLAQPVANFNSDIQSGCSPIVVNFQDLSVGNPTSWLWDFGNGATSTKQNPSTTYFQSGAYDIKLTATNANGSNTVIKRAFINVYDQPLPDFKVDKVSGCSPVRVQFSDTSTTPANTKISAWKWDFGDGGSSTAQNPQYIYKNPGNYTVTLSISNDKGCTRVITKPNLIDVATGVVPGINYVDPSVCSAPATVNFTNASTGPGTLTYRWNFGNGNTSTAKDPSNLYNRNGTYNVSLNVISSSGCSDSTAISIVIGKVNTDFTIPATICPKTRAQFLNNSNPRPIRSSWQFSNGFTDTTRNTFATFDTAGTYTVTLTNTYTVCTDVLTKTFTVSAAPAVNFTASDTGKCNIPFAVNFSTSTTAVSYLWDFGDSTSSTQSNASHTYTKFGDYTVSLIATGANGCSDTLRKPAFIKVRKPVISFPNLPTGGCIPYTFSFLSKIETVDLVTSYKWDFGDGVGTSTLEKPSYTYSKQGTYAVSLTITTKGGCTETFRLNDAVKVGSKPVADFKSDVTTACANPGVSFTNLSTNATTFKWELSDGSSSTAKDPTIIFSDTGWIDVKLIADNNGCKDSITKLRYIFINPSVSKFNYQPDCNNKLQYTFTDNSIGALTWNWNFGDGTTFTGPNPPVHNFPANGTYNVSLTTTNGSCSYEISRTITIADYTPDFTSTSREGCKPFTTTFYPSAPNAPAIKSYIWDFGDGNPIDFGQGTYGQFSYANSGTYNITLTTIDTFGCKNVITKNAYIRVNGPVANFTSVSN